LKSYSPQATQYIAIFDIGQPHDGGCRTFILCRFDLSD
jgi:hypothetical protein